MPGRASIAEPDAPAAPGCDGSRNPGRRALLLAGLSMLAVLTLDGVRTGSGAAWAKNGDDDSGGGSDDSGGGGGRGGDDSGGSNSGSGNSGSDDSGSGHSGSDDNGSDDNGSDDSGSGHSGSGNGGSGNGGSGNGGSGNGGSGNGGSGNGGSGNGGSHQELMQVRFVDGHLEQVRDGKFERTDRKGRIVEQRRANQNDIARIANFRSNAQGSVQSVIQVSARQGAAQLTDGAGWVETISNGVYQLTDPNGNQVTRRKASGDDLARIRAMAGFR